MVRIRYNQGWPRKGFAFLWDTDVLASLCPPERVVSIREFFSMAQDWPEDLPAGGGDTLVVAGVEGCLECLSSDEAEKWLETDLKDAILEFQDEYDGQAGLVFWVPSGKNRINMNGATEEYFWKHRSGSTTKDIHIGRLLWAGAEDEIERLLDTEDANADYDGKCWIGLHHPRIS